MPLTPLHIQGKELKYKSFSMNYIEKEALDAYPVDMTPLGDDNGGHREAFQEGFERALKCMHAWACGKYNESERNYRKEVSGGFYGSDVMCNKSEMNAFHEMKREIMSMYTEVAAMDLEPSNLKRINDMKHTAILYVLHEEIARIPIDDIDYIYQIVDGIRVETINKNYECDEIEFII